MVTSIEAQKEFLRAYTQDEEGASLFIGVFEEVVGYKQTKLIARVPIFFQKFYDEDVLDEDAILAWFESTADPWIMVLILPLIFAKRLNRLFNGCKMLTRMNLKRRRMRAETPKLTLRIVRECVCVKGVAWICVHIWWIV
eukprot:TRINITY_DN397_c0_g1_i6.p2 TRINITY_DN397_c0_g1~~TRINITY_DN397_c0_g1_i6.p2  ORF type:complete len:140 (-),score=24.57 TRINITY_DN397_c0_g1_i6:43-462(-)